MLCLELGKRARVPRPQLNNYHGPDDEQRETLMQCNGSHSASQAKSTSLYGISNPRFHFS
jgi:hypothetical protein